MTHHELISSKLPSFLQLPLLARQDGNICANLHPTIVSMYEEAKWMRRLNLKVPPAYHALTMANMKETYDQIKVHIVFCYLGDIHCCIS